MTYDVSLIQNNSDMNVATANPAAQRDTYFVAPNEGRNPDHNVEINHGKQGWRSEEAFLKSNFIYTGVYAYCFWDSGESQVFAFKHNGGGASGNPEAIYAGSAGDLVLTVNKDGTISFTPASH